MLNRIPRPVWALAFIICLVSVMTLALVKDSPTLIDTGWDKGNHVLAFSVLTFLGRMAYPDQRFRLLIGLFAYGVLIENLQLLTGYRFSEYQDLVADVVGMAVGYLLAMPLAKVTVSLR
ncbi:VanZ family protein [Pseudomonas sp. MAP12]|uniref:VanZ family protein n=1 Tax=Geopseudomonas aromaticivorans TaxID=2849492 RepID=A0ABS6MVU5_9GAMM|nr:VanZ family protein [Pseudomonas aromaticivorans]MBV2132938.1 VanZ family protein [Pseudomonas aromaticivorans]